MGTPCSTRDASSQVSTRPWDPEGTEADGKQRCPGARSGLGQAWTLSFHPHHGSTRYPQSFTASISFGCAPAWFLPDCASVFPSGAWVTPPAGSLTARPRARPAAFQGCHQWLFTRSCT